MVYVLIYQVASSDLPLKLQNLWGEGKYYMMSDRVAFVKEPNGSTGINATTVAEKAGMSAEGQLTGVVFPVRGHYNGWHNSQLWEWLYAALTNG